MVWVEYIGAVFIVFLICVSGWVFCVLGLCGWVWVLVDLSLGAFSCL